jgi:hypothetical protein
MRNYYRLFTIILLLSLFSTACEKNREYPDINLPSTSVLSIETNWGVVNSSHLRLREKPRKDALPVALLYRGFVIEITSRTQSLSEIEGKSAYWYHINYDGLTGWVFGGYLDIFDSKDEANRAARRLN